MGAAARAPRPSRPRLRVPEGRDPALVWTAINRLSNARSVAHWRARHGEVPASATGYVEIIADALRHADVGGRRYTFDVPAIREHWLPREWRDCITDDEIYAVVQDVERTRTPDALMTAREAGRLLGLHLTEVEAMEAGGTHVSFPAVDLSPAEHEARCLERKRAGWREASRRYREAKKVAVERHRFPVRGGNDAACNLPAASQADAIRAAVEAGAVTVGDVVAATGLPATSVKPLLSRMVRAGTIIRTGWGCYAPTSPFAQQDGEECDAAAGTIPTGPDIPTEPHDPTVEMERNTPALHPMADAGGAPKARGTAGACRPRTPGGPEGVIRLVPSIALTFRRQAFSRLPGALSIPFTRSTTNAPPRCA